MFYELVYHSIATPTDNGADELARIVAGARKRNIELGNTGVLLYQGGAFVQLLEGTRDAVRHVYYDIICLDRRHRAMEVDYEQSVEQRGFANWTKGFADLPMPDSTSPPVLTDKIEGYLPELDFSGPVSTGRRLLAAIYRQL
jgi:hypothetical protein